MDLVFVRVSTKGTMEFRKKNKTILVRRLSILKAVLHKNILTNISMESLLRIDFT